MTIASYSDLVSAIEDWMGRTDISDHIPDFITMFEARANRTLRVRQMETSTDLTTSSGTASLPSDYLGFRSATYNATNTNELAYETPTNLRARFPNTNQGTPVIFTVEGSSFITRPVDDTTTTTLHYYQAIPPLQTNAVNWLITAYPDAYLFGTLVEANARVQNAQAAVLWQARLDQVMQDITDLDAATKGGGSVRPVGWIA